jgi:hypothetical protein
MRTGLWIAGLIGGLSLGMAPARADVVYQNPADLSGAESGNCLFNSACASAAGAPQRYAAQEFTLGSAATIAAIGFTTVLQGSGYGTLANWMLLNADGTGGLPGTVVASGTGAALSHANGAAGSLDGTTIDYSFNVTAFSLMAATAYYVAVQEFSAEQNDYLLQGLATSGAANSLDGGASWSAFYVDKTSVAVTLYGSATNISEPGSLMLIGTGVLGLTLRRRRNG